ncbi:unnamed protein product, partial [Symbiodinium sp. KB8]
ASPPTGEKPAGKQGGNGKGKAKPKSSAASKHNKEQEKKAKELLCMLERSQQIVDRVVGEADRFPSEWTWCKPLLQEFRCKQEEFQKTLNPAGAEDLTEFINEFRLSIITPAALKDLKKNHKDNYFQLLSVFIDRMNHTASKIDNMAKAMMTASAGSVAGTPKPKKKTRKATGLVKQ